MLTILDDGKFPLILDCMEEVKFCLWASKRAIRRDNFGVALMYLENASYWLEPLVSGVAQRQ